ncbi:MAG: type VII toxin-antitoxin system HepT family RNase toxin [Thermincolia bacterium]
MVDKEKIRSKLQTIEGNTAKLKQLASYSLNDFLQDFRNVEAAKHLLQVNVEAMLDVANHISARNRWKTPGTSTEALMQLEQNGYLETDDLDTFNKMVKFRNRVVHLYHMVDDQEIYKILQENLDDFGIFVKRIVNKVF